jgi:hypothetical protein
MSKQHSGSDMTFGPPRSALSCLRRASMGPDKVRAARSRPNLGDDNRSVVRIVNELDRGRESYSKSRWVDAYESLATADQTTPLSAEDLELLAT